MTKDKFIPTPMEIELGMELDREFPKQTDAIKWAAHLIRNEGWTKIEPKPGEIYGYESRECKDFMGRTYYELELYKNGESVNWWAFRHITELDAQILTITKRYGPFDD